MKKLKLGLVGCGGRMKNHLSGLVKMENVEIVSVADPIEARTAQFAEIIGTNPKQYKNHTELYDNAKADGVEAVFIAIEPTAHTDTETRAIELGLPFVVEKPMHMDLKEAEKIAAAVEAKGLITSVGFQDRYLDLMEKVKEEIEKQPKKGGLVYGAWVGGIPGVWWWQKKTDCGGQLIEQNIHLLDGLRWLYGEPLSVYATAERGIVEAGVDASAEYDTDDHSTVVLRFPNHVTATLVSGCYSKSIRPNCGLYISMQDVVLDYRLRNNLIISKKGETHDYARSMDQTYKLDEVFVDAVLNNDPSKIRSPYADALKSLKVCFAANESMESGQVIYF